MHDKREFNYFTLILISTLAAAVTLFQLQGCDSNTEEDKSGKALFNLA